jgi:hypothetical protein
MRVLLGVHYEGLGEKKTGKEQRGTLVRYSFEAFIRQEAALDPPILSFLD